METNARERTSKKKKKSGAGKSVKVLIAIVLVLLLALGGMYYYFVFRDRQAAAIAAGDTFHQGITVNGVDVGGMTIAEAKTALASSAEKEIADSVHLNFICEGKTYTADSSCFTITYTTDEVLSEAMALAREGTFEQLLMEMKDIRDGGREFAIDYTVEPTGVEAFLHSFADETTTPAVPASFAPVQLEINKDTKTQNSVNVGLPEDGSITDLRDLRFTFTEAVDGYGIDIAAVMKTVNERCAAKDFGDIDTPFTNIKSDVTIETLKQDLVLRSSAYTSYKSSRSNKNRVFNLKKATGAVYGTILQPGEEFSANTILGDRTERNGWMMAPAVIGGGAAHEDQPGGGVCQISTTTYQAVLMGDLEVTYRRGHSSKSGYADGGLDCTINTGTIDFTWKNSTDAPLYIFTWVDTENYRVNCEIYGKPLPEEYDAIELTSELIETIVPGPVEYVVDSSLYSPYWYLKNEAKDGYKYTAYANYMKDGKIVKTVEINTTTYNMHPTRYCVWPGYDGSTLTAANELKLDDTGSLVLASPELAAAVAAANATPANDSIVQ